MLDPNFVIVGTVIGAVGSLGYFIATLKGRVKPNRVTFLLWSLAPLIAFFAEVGEGVGIQSLMTFSVGFFPLTIFIASFLNKKSEWKLRRFDVICGVLSFIGLVLWLITRVGNVAILFSITADSLAALPTIVKAYKYPETEKPWPWLTVPLNGLFTLLTIDSWNFAHYGFPLYILISGLVIYVLVKFKIGKRIAR